MAREFNVSDTDYDQIRNNLKIFLENDNELSDYNFNGAVLTKLVDFFAYGAHYNAVYANQAINETFLDTALIRSSVVSRAKELGYIPRQYTGAFVEVTINVVVPIGDSRTVFEIPRGIKFNGDRDGKTISFVTTEQFILTNKIGNTFSGVITIRQGSYVKDVFIFNATERNPLYQVTPEQVDTEFTQVEVLPFSGSASKEIFTTSQSIVEIMSTSAVFFWQESVKGDVEFYFGDGVIGKSLDNGNEICITTLSTKGSEGNNVNSFGVAENISDINRSNISISESNISRGGSDKESIESIRNLAPRLFSVQDRLVTLEDYRAYINKNFGNIQSLAVWSGDENVPPFFGRVFISIKPDNSDTLSNFEKNKIITGISDKIVTGISVKIVDPELLFVNVNSVVTYDRTTTNFFAEQFENIVTESIEDFFDDNINDLGNDLIYSRLVSSIDNSNSAIVGNLTNVSLSKKFIPTSLGTTYLFDFVNSLEPLSFNSNIWTDGFNSFQLKEVNSGIIDLFRDGVLLNSDVGTINQTSGLVEFRNFNPSININEQITLNVNPLTNDIISLRNNILVRDNILVSVVEK